MSEDRLEIPLEISEPYEKLLAQQEEYVHAVVKSIFDCKLDDVRHTRCEDIDRILNFFSGSTQKKKREALVEFLKICPEYRTTDQDVLYQRLKCLEAELRRKGEISELLIWAKLKYQREQKQTE